ncbi:MAG: Uma2 family endonuclease [Roseiflexaceae bacterium]
MSSNTQHETLRLSWEQGGELVLSLDPLQGYWTETQYLLLTDQTQRLLEYTDGLLEVLPMPTEHHQAILEWLFLALRAFVEQIGGKVRFAPLRLQIRDGKYREPDILLVCDANDPRRQNRYWLGADLVVEIVSADDPERDTQVKREDYAEAGIREYWIVNPIEQHICVLVLEDQHYHEYGVYQRGSAAHSLLLAGFSVNVDAVLDAQ